MSMVINPGFTKYLTSPTLFVFTVVVEGVFMVFAVTRNIEGVSRSTHANNRFAGIGIVGNVLHLVIWQIAEA